MATKREIELQKESNRLQKESNQLLSEQLKRNKESVKESDGISNTLQDKLKCIINYLLINLFNRNIVWV